MSRRAYQPAATGRPVVALCHWEDWNYAHVAEGESFWVRRKDDPAAVRASLGQKMLTVWLPGGAVIRNRLGRFGNEASHMAARYTHVYGSHERMSRTRICITLRELPHA